ncbi:MAG: peptidoglycan editing factor PgeF [Anaerolineaceae bacterium]
MKTGNFGSIRYYSFENMAEAGVTQAIFTRSGGVSRPPYATLNTGGTVGDDPRAVTENRQRCFTSLALDLRSMYDVWQVHSSAVAVANAPRPADQLHLQADIILTNKPGVTLFMRFADCVPIILVDPTRHAIGMAHAGWIGTVNKVAAKSVQAMHEQFGSRPDDLLAGIGPSICVEHYPIGEDVISKVKEAFPDRADELLTKNFGQTHLNLWKANRFILEEQGVENIETSGICTACHVEDWFSHRGEQGKTGRFGALLALAR